MISGCCRDVGENCALLGCYTVVGGSSVPVFQDNIAVPSSRVKKFFLTFEDGTDRFSQNVGT
jgi:hypothetical protein